MIKSRRTNKLVSPQNSDCPTSQKFAALLEDHRLGILMESESRRVTFANQMYCDMFGVTAEPSELVGSDATDLGHRIRSLTQNPEDCRRRVDLLRQDRSIVIGDVLRLSDRRVLQRDYVPMMSNGEFFGHLWQYRDITEHSEIQSRIQADERLCAAVEQTADSVVITDRQGIIEYVNPAFEDTTGYSRAEALGETPRILNSGMHDQEFYRQLWQQILSGQPFRGTIRNRRKNGGLYWSQQTITPVVDAAGSISHFVSVLKDITDLIEKREYEAKVSLVRKVQQRFYRVTASVPDFDIAGRTLPVDETGGDYFDFIQLPDGCLGIAVGDVCGHGIEAALVMVETRAYVRAFAAQGANPAEILTRVNQALIPDLEKGQFVTLLVGRLDSGSRLLSYASAGHVPGYVLGHDGTLDRVIGGTGPPLGLFGDSRYSCDEVPLGRSGRAVLLPTDGVTDMVNGDDVPFGIDRTLQFVGSHRHQGAAQLAEELCRAVRGYAEGEPQLDDITAVIIKAL